MTVRKVNHHQTLMWAQCLACEQIWEAGEDTGSDGQQVVNLRRQMSDHARRTGHAIRFHEKRTVEGRFEV